EVGENASTVTCVLCVEAHTRKTRLCSCNPRGPGDNQKHGCGTENRHRPTEAASMNRRLLHLVVSKSLGCLLLAAAGLKIYGFGMTPVGAIGIFSSPSFQVGLIEFEILLGLWLLSGKSPIGSWLVAIAGFASFGAVSFYLGWIGQASCGCFGQLSVSPWYAFGIDLVAILALLVGQPDLKQL